MVKVSVIVPVYNVEKYLRECLDSLIGQTLADIEIIAINDGSPDNSLQILEEYAARDKRIKIINQKNAGVSAARNNGVKEAVGEFVAFVDSDDWVSVDFCEKLYEAAAKENADIAAGTIVSCSEEGKMVGKVPHKKYRVAKKLKDKWRYLLDKGEHCYICDKIYRREALLRSGVEFVVGKRYEDMLWLPFVVKKLGVGVIVSEGVYNYRHNPNSQTGCPSDKDVEDYKKARANLVAFAGYNKLEVSFDPLRRCKYKLLGIPFLKIEYGDTGFRFYFLGICCLKKEMRQRM